ncbi:MAG: hypothetical protein M3Q36_02620 [bacterium]|nr:hypothetical protein [bacterium]
MKYYYQTGLIVPFAQKYYKQLILAVAAIFMSSFAMITSVSNAATPTAVVSPSSTQGFVLGRDLTNATPYNFNEVKASIGEGSLYVQPIGANPLHKFIAEKAIGVAIEDFNSVSYNFLIAGDGTVDDADQFYLNVYTNAPDPSSFYDCRYDYVPTTGSTTNFTTATFNATETPTLVVDRFPSDSYVCPATLAAGAGTVKFISLNVGDTSANDSGLAGYFDKVVLNIGEDVTTYDFEADQETVTVTINKNVDGAQATATSANNASFPMVSTWEAENLNGGVESSGAYTLSPTAYQAVTSEMTEGADYTTNEVTTGNTVVAASCAGSGAQFALIGYTTGDTLAEAQAGTPSATIPAFTDLQNDKFVVVWNETCEYVTNKDECKNGVWALGLADGRTFKNQGDCVSFFATKMKNPPAGTTTTTRRR